MPEQTDPNFLANEEYPDASALGTRIRIQERYRTHPQNWFEWIFDRLEMLPEARILELGCGPGDVWLKNRTRLPAGWKLVLTDLSPGMLADARLRLRGAGLTDRLQWAAVDLQAIPFTEDVFEAVIGNGVLDHVPDRVRALNEIRRVLKPGEAFIRPPAGGHICRRSKPWCSPSCRKPISAATPGSLAWRMELSCFHPGLKMLPWNATLTNWYFKSRNRQSPISYLKRG